MSAADNIQALEEAAQTCDQCGRTVQTGRSFSFKARSVTPGLAPGETTKCMSCAVRHRPMLRRSFIAALVVGTVLTVLNQGDALVSGQWSSALLWKIPLTYCVPFVVASYGALINSRK